MASLDREGALGKLLLVVAVAVVLGSQPAAAQRTTFFPSLFLEEARNGNVAYLGASSTEFRPDWSTRLGVSLVLRREGRAGTAGVRYGGYYEKYRKFSDLDHREHMLGVDLASAAGRRSSLGFSTSYSYGQAQGNPASLEAPDRYLSQRTTRQALAGTLRYDRNGSGRWSWGVSSYGSALRFHRISGLPEEPTAATVEDRNEYGAGAGLRFAMSPRLRLGWGYTFTRYDLKATGREDVQDLSMSFDLGVGRNARLAFRIGAFERRAINAEGEAQPVERGLGLDTSGGVSITRTGREVATTFSADRRASSGGTLMGTSTDTTAGITVTNVRQIRWYWSASARYALRESTLADMSNVQSLAFGGSVERRFRTMLALRVTATFVRQISGDVALEGSAPQGLVGLVWSPRGYDVGR